MSEEKNEQTNELYDDVPLRASDVAVPPQRGTIQRAYLEFRKDAKSGQQVLEIAARVLRGEESPGEVE